MAVGRRAVGCDGNQILMNTALTYTTRIYATLGRATTQHGPKTSHAVLVRGANGDVAWRGLVTIAESIDPRPYMFQSALYGRLICTVIV